MTKLERAVLFQLGTLRQGGTADFIGSRLGRPQPVIDRALRNLLDRHEVAATVNGLGQAVYIVAPRWRPPH